MELEIISQMRNELGTDFKEETFKVMDTSEMPKSYPQLEKYYSQLKDLTATQSQILEDLRVEIEAKDLKQIAKKIQEHSEFQKETKAKMEEIQNAFAQDTQDARDFKKVFGENRQYEAEMKSIHKELKTYQNETLPILHSNSLNSQAVAIQNEFKNKLNQFKFAYNKERIETNLEKIVKSVKEAVAGSQEASRILKAADKEGERQNIRPKRGLRVNQHAVILQDLTNRIHIATCNGRSDLQKIQEINSANYELSKELFERVAKTLGTFEGLVHSLKGLDEILDELQNMIPPAYEKLDKIEAEYPEKDYEKAITLKKISEWNLTKDTKALAPLITYADQIMASTQKELNFKRKLTEETVNAENFEKMMKSMKKLNQREQEMRQLEDEKSRYESYGEKHAEFQQNFKTNEKSRKALRKQKKEEQARHDEEYETKFDYRGVNILVRKANLIHENSEAIVNPANCELDHAGGAARAISDAAGEEFDIECRNYIKENTELPTGKSMITSAGGELQCHKVIHTVGPVYNTKSANNIKQENQLRDAFNSVLEIMKEEDLKSVSCPAISTGIFSFPIMKCCMIMAKTLRNFIDSNPQSMDGKQIVFCNFDEPTTKVFKQNLEMYFNEEEQVDEDDESPDEVDESQDDSEEEAKASKKASRRKKKYSDSEELEDSDEEVKPKKSKKSKTAKSGKTSKKSKKKAQEEFASDDY
jgi:O-acetyl-ADP-ribose deacetylase (regulator of RNase III)/enoyl-[acyl-carrier-protein] reductase (NADH)